MSIILENYLECLDNIDCDVLLKLLLIESDCLSNLKVCDALKQAVKKDIDGNIYLDLPIYLRTRGLLATELLRVGGDANYSEFSDVGILNMEGDARVYRGTWVPFNALKAPGTKPATFKEWGISGAWEFSDGTDDTIVFNLAIPFDMDRTGVPIIRIGWSTNTAVITETAVWQLEYLHRAEGEDTTAAAQETLTVNSNAIAQSNGLTIAEFIGMDLPSDLDVCTHYRLKRLGADGNDDLTDTAELHGVCFKYISDKLGIPL